MDNYDLKFMGIVAGGIVGILLLVAFLAQYNRNTETPTADKKVSPVQVNIIVYDSTQVPQIMKAVGEQLPRLSELGVK